ncbi:epoxide hydrolase family protein [Phytoactinopolyspora mesophila]|uniref:Alpha/beta fold hydrolase n=1 Tax=Phytoactinopolyspora mesophila TaxID=2650750 RepID=A0A7K3ME82_9ACTN|nr:epoxide hydrolase family protein [Phytoactinopolyspora mesophila]NDL60718.1 alpha/beta fold hydrolase [Phytoactinopolyspora mesophila]
MTNTAGIERFRIDIPQADVDDLRERLARTRWPSDIAGAGWSRGVPVDYLKDLVEYWRTTFDWRAQEAKLNAFDQYTTEIDGHDIHFVHVRSPEPNAMPLMITHGWPGSVVEFMEIVGPLTDPGRYGGDPADAFHVIAPSIPGFGFSGPTREEGWNVQRIATAWAELMRRLGYERYVVQGGDFGSQISRELSLVDRDHVAAIHVNGGFTLPFEVDEAEVAALPERDQERMAYLYGYDIAYTAIQAAKPQTLAYGLTDSPVGQAAWIVEKFKEWSDPAKDLPEDAVDIDQLLTNVSVYWFTGTAGSSAQIYRESANGWGAEPEVSDVPAGVALFTTRDVALRHVDERKNNIVHWSDYDRGGHFAAMEAPDLLIDDVREFFRVFRK